MRPIAVLLLISGCGAAPPLALDRPRPPLAPLQMLVPRGAHTVIMARPSMLMASSARQVVDAAWPRLLRDAFARRFGVEPAEIEELVYAVYDDGSLLWVRGTWPAAEVVRANALRMSPLTTRSDEPFVRRAGWLGAERADLAALDDHVVLVARRADPRRLAVLEHALTGAFAEGHSALFADPDAAALLGRFRDAPFALYAPEPLALGPDPVAARAQPAGARPTVSPVVVLLARERSLAVAVRPEGPEGLSVEVALRGAFPATAEDNFRRLAESIAGSSLGRAAGFAEAVTTLEVRTRPGAVDLRFSWSAERLARGARVALTAGIPELLDLSWDR